MHHDSNAHRMSSMELHGEHSDRGREATDWVSVWAANDEPAYRAGQRLADQGDIQGMRDTLVSMLTNAEDGSAAWHTARDMSERDYDRVDWHEVAHQLSSE